MANANLAHSAVRSISLTLDAEVMADDETGALSLVVSTSPQLSDFAEVSPARLRDMVAAFRGRLAEVERLADEQEARDTLAALLAEHDVELEEWDTSSLDERLRPHLQAVHDPTVGRRTIVVPAGQDPIDRLGAVRKVIAKLGGVA
jgi:hypothetical protein